MSQSMTPLLVEELIREEQSQRQQLEQRAERFAAKLREMAIDPDFVKRSW